MFRLPSFLARGPCRFRGRLGGLCIGRRGQQQLIQSMRNVAFELGLEGFEQESKRNFEADLARADFHPAGDAAAVKVQRVAFPPAFKVVLLGQVVRGFLRNFFRLRNGERMLAREADVGHRLSPG